MPGPGLSIGRHKWSSIAFADWTVHRGCRRAPEQSECRRRQVAKLVAKETRPALTSRHHWANTWLLGNSSRTWKQQQAGRLEGANSRAGRDACHEVGWWMVLGRQEDGGGSPPKRRPTDRPPALHPSFNAMPPDLPTYLPPPSVPPAALHANRSSWLPGACSHKLALSSPRRIGLRDRRRRAPQPTNPLLHPSAAHHRCTQVRVYGIPVPTNSHTAALPSSRAPSPPPASYPGPCVLGWDLTLGSWLFSWAPPQALLQVPYWWWFTAVVWWTATRPPAVCRRRPTRRSISCSPHSSSRLPTAP